MNNIIQIGKAILGSIQTLLKNLWHNINIARHNFVNKLHQKPSKPEIESESVDGETQVQPLRTSSKMSAYKPPKAKPIRRHGRQRVYRLKGYTTVAKINRKRQSERQQRLLRHILIIIVVVLVVILMFNLYNPIRNLAEWYRIIGVDKIADLTKIQTTAPMTTTSGTTSSSIATAASTK
jgi:hypothetical protein